VHSALVDEGFQVPSHNRDATHVRWRVPGYGYLNRMLLSPVYGGAYVYGQRQVEESIDEAMRPVKRMRKRERKDWHVLIPDHHDGYISWEQYERNQRQIESNRRGPGGPGAPRSGNALLQGLVMCGRCGRRMRVSYGGPRQTTLRFLCAVARRQTGGPICQSLGGTRLERAVEELVLEALKPLGLEAMTEAAAAQAQESEGERRRWEQRLERARYEVDLAHRQYDEVDPANRLVARELERRWEEALKALQRTEQEAAERIERLETPLSNEDKERLRCYASDLLSLWEAPTTRPQDRKRIVRLLVEQIVVRVSEDGKAVEARVHWSGGEISDLVVAKTQRGETRYVAPSELLDLICTLAEEFSGSQIAGILNRRGLLTPKGLTFTPNRVAVTRNNHGIEKGPAVPRKGDDIYSAQQAAKLLGVDRTTVVRWVERGLLKGAQFTEAAPWRIQVTGEDIERLRPAESPEGWVSLKAAASALGLSQQGVLQKLNCGDLEGVRGNEGRRPSWRIRLTPTAYDQQPALFAPDETETI
jgi:transposase-like protein